MEYCISTDFDLFETIKLISPYLLAIGVYWIWHIQKKREVLAKFAQELVLKDMNVHSEIYKKDGINIQDQSEIIKDYCNNIKFFSFLAKKKHKTFLNDLYDEYSTLRNEINSKEYDQSKVKQLYRDIRTNKQDKYMKVMLYYINFKLW